MGGVLPVGPYRAKRSAPIEEIVPGQVWTVDQKFGILNVQVPVRMSIVKLSGGGLFILNPIAATRELLDMVHSLEKEHGPVKHAEARAGLEDEPGRGACADDVPVSRELLRAE